MDTRDLGDSRPCRYSILSAVYEGCVLPLVRKLPRSAIIIVSPCAVSTYIPSIDPQNKTAVIESFYLLQYPNCGNEIKPVVILVASLEDQAKVYLGIWLRGTRSLNEYVRAIICLQIVPRIRTEHSRLRVGQSPVCAEV